MYPIAPVKIAAPPLPAEVSMKLVCPAKRPAPPMRGNVTPVVRQSSYASLMPVAPEVPRQAKVAVSAPAGPSMPAGMAAVVAGSAAMVASTVKLWGMGAAWASQLGSGLLSLWAQASAVLPTLVLPVAAPVAAVMALGAAVSVAAYIAATWVSSAAKDITVKTLEIVGGAGHKASAALKSVAKASIRGARDAARAAARGADRIALMGAHAFKKSVSAVFTGRLGMQIYRLGQLVCEGTYNTAVATVLSVNFTLSFLGRCVAWLLQASRELWRFLLQLVGVKSAAV